MFHEDICRPEDCPGRVKTLSDLSAEDIHLQKLREAILDNTRLLRHSPVLVVCYTNHALDQPHRQALCGFIVAFANESVCHPARFLEGIFKFCESTVRIGDRVVVALGRLTARNSARHFTRSARFAIKERADDAEKSQGALFQLLMLQILFARPLFRSLSWECHQAGNSIRHHSFCFLTSSSSTSKQRFCACLVLTMM